MADIKILWADPIRKGVARELANGEEAGGGWGFKFGRGWVPILTSQRGAARDLRARAEGRGEERRRWRGAAELEPRGERLLLTLGANGQRARGGGKSPPRSSSPPGIGSAQGRASPVLPARCNYS